MSVRGTLGVAVAAVCLLGLPAVVVPGPGRDIGRNEVLQAEQAWGEEGEDKATALAPPVSSGPSPKHLLRAAAQTRAMLAAEGELPGGPAQAGARTAAWRSLGPSNLGGRTHSLVIHPENPDVMYAGGIGGGVWKTTTGGKDWFPLGDTLSNIAIGSLVMDPADPQVLYAGTGDAVDLGFRTTALGEGIMKTTDGGQTWNFLPETQNKNFVSVPGLHVSQNDRNRIYAITNTGAWRSNDGGATWQQFYQATNPIGCFDLTVTTKQNPDQLVWSCGGAYGLTEGVFRSVDGGNTYELVISTIGNEIAGRAAVAYAPSNENIVYASVADTQGGEIALLRSDQGGAPDTWVVQNKGDGSTPGSNAWLSNCWGGDPAGQGQGWYGNVLAVDPTNPDRIWLGGVDSYRSDDGGKTLGLASYWWFYFINGYNQELDGTPYMHADFHAIVFHPRYDGVQNNTVFFGNDGGIFKTDNGTAPVGVVPFANCDQAADSKVTYTELNDGYVTSLFREGAVSADGSVIAGGLQDNGTWLDADLSAGSNPWAQVGGGDGAFTVLDPGGQTVYQTAQYGYIEKSTDQGRTTVGAMAGINERGPFISPLVMDPSNPSILWNGRPRVWRTMDGAASWQAVSPDFPGDERDSMPSTIAVAPSDGNVVYVGTGSADGKVYKTTNGLSPQPSWTDVSGPLNQWEISAFAIHPTDPNTAYVAVDTFNRQAGRVWRTTNGGQSWENLDGSGPTGLPQTGALSIALNPLNPSMVYVGTSTGVFESLDGGTTWRVANENLATTGVEDLVFQPNSSELFAFTYGRGVYRVDVGTAAPPANDAIAGATEVVMNPDFRDRVNTRLATPEAGDPPVSCGAGGQQQNRSVWYRFSSSDNSTYTLSTEGSNYDTVLAVYEGSSGALAERACDDDGAEGGASRLQFQAGAGVTYFIEVTRSSDAGEGIGGSLHFSVTR